MKISKRVVTACEECGCQEPESAISDVIVAEAPAAMEVVAAPAVNPYGEAIANIRLAIDFLGSLAKSDPVARESIANLSVVLFDLVG